MAMRSLARNERMPKRSLGDWLTYLEQVHPQSIELGLSRVTEVAERLGLLPFNAPVVTVAGTNGKGSVVYCTEAILRESGLRTGRYTSPHLLQYNERIAIDGLPCADECILDAFNAIEQARDEVTLTYFEFATLAALWVFRAYAVDVAILEVGLGGRLDAVNIVDCDVAVITAIALDHQSWLGDTVEEIAPEKAGIARSQRAVVLAEATYPATLEPSLIASDAIIERAGEHWSWASEASKQQVEVSFTRSGESLRVTAAVPQGLRGANVAAAVRASAIVCKDPKVLAAGLRGLESLTVPARRQQIEIGGRTLVLDVAHNPAAMHALIGFLDSQAVKGRTVAALGVMADKNVAGICRILSEAVSGACALDIPGIDRAETPERLWAALDKAGIAIAQSEFSMASVWARLWSGTDAGDRIVICGSFHTVGNGLAFLLDRDSPWAKYFPEDFYPASQLPPEQFASRAGLIEGVAHG